MITYVLLISTKFPKTHPKAGASTGFPLSIKHYDKLHTLRANYELWEKRFKKIDAGKAVLSVRIWDGLPYKSKQIEIFRYDYRRKIGIEKIENPDNFLFAEVSNQKIDWRTIAKNDGLAFDDFCHWFNPRPKEPMAIIHFTQFRYSLTDL